MINKRLYNEGIQKNLFAILFSAFAVKIILAILINTELRSDSYVYYSLAKSIADFGTYSFEGKTTATLSCGYPLFAAFFIKVFGDGQFWIKAFQSFLEIFSGYLFFRICRNYFREKYSLLAALIFIFLPSNLLFSQTILTESLFGFLSLALLYYCLNQKINKYIFLIGMVWGYSILVRSSFSFSIILLPLFLFTHGRDVFEGYSHSRMKRALMYSVLFLFGAAIVIAPWLIRNKVTMNTFTIATQGGFTFWSGSNPDATGTWYYKIEESNPLFNIEDEAVRDKEFYKLGIDYALKNPHKFLIAGVKKLGYLFSSERMILLYFAESESGKTSTEIYKSINPFLIALVNIPYFIIMLAGAWGLLALDKKRFFIYGFIIIWCITIFIFVALARYHYVLIPFFIIGTANLLFERKNIFKKLSKSKIAFAACFNLFLLAVWISEFYLLITK